MMKLGKTVMTRAIAIKKSASWNFKRFVDSSLKKFMCEDFGYISDDDKQVNKESLASGGMVMGAYGECENRIWIVRDDDGNGSYVTMVLFPDEY